VSQECSNPGGCAAGRAGQRMARGAETGRCRFFVGGAYADFEWALAAVQHARRPRPGGARGPPGARYVVKLMINLLWFSQPWPRPRCWRWV